MNIREIKFKVRIVVEPDGDQYYAHCPDLRGLHVCGSDSDDAVQNAKEAVLVHLENQVRAGEPLPVGFQVDEYESITQLVKEKVARKMGFDKSRSVVESIELQAFA